MFIGYAQVKVGCKVQFFTLAQILHKQAASKITERREASGFLGLFFLSCWFCRGFIRCFRGAIVGWCRSFRVGTVGKLLVGGRFVKRPLADEAFQVILEQDFFFSAVPVQRLPDDGGVPSAVF